MRQWRVAWRVALQNQGCVPVTFYWRTVHVVHVQYVIHIKNLVLVKNPQGGHFQVIKRMRSFASHDPPCAALILPSLVMVMPTCSCLC